MDGFCREKSIKREYNVARTPQQNGVTERRNRILIKAARTMLADSKLPTTFWAKAVSTESSQYSRFAMYKNKPQNKTPYELFRSLGKFDGQNDEVFFVRLAAGTISNESGQVNKKNLMQVEDGLHNESDENDKSDDDSSPKEVNIAGQHVNTTSPAVNTGHFKLNTIDPSVNTTKDQKNEQNHTSEQGSTQCCYYEQKQPDTLNTKFIMLVSYHKLNPQALLKLHTDSLGGKQCMKNFCNSNSNRYLKGKPTLGLWYSRDSPFELVAYIDSDYAEATQDRKCTTGGCQFLGNMLISWHCKKQLVVPYLYN
ncbi:ribonuclease H-like domain-containing protein [Tanacetum coccineum]